MAVHRYNRQTLGLRLDSAEEIALFRHFLREHGFLRPVIADVVEAFRFTRREDSGGWSGASSFAGYWRIMGVSSGIRLLWRQIFSLTCRTVAGID